MSPVFETQTSISSTPRRRGRSAAGLMHGSSNFFRSPSASARKRRSSSVSSNSSASEASYVYCSSFSSSSSESRENRRSSYPFVNTARFGAGDKCNGYPTLSIKTCRGEDSSQSQTNDGQPYGALFVINNEEFVDVERLMIFQGGNECATLRPGTQVYMFNKDSQTLHAGFEIVLNEPSHVSQLNWPCSTSMDRKRVSLCPFQLRLKRVYACPPVGLAEIQNDFNLNLSEWDEERVLLTKTESVYLTDKFGVKSPMASPIPRCGDYTCLSDSSYWSQESVSIDSSTSSCTCPSEIKQVRAIDISDKVNAINLNSSGCFCDSGSCDLDRSESTESHLYTDSGSVNTIEEELQQEQRPKAGSRGLLWQAMIDFTRHVDREMSLKGGHTSYSGSDAFTLCSIVQQLIRTIWPTASVEMYGSLSTGLWLPGQSDLDILINFHRYHAANNSMVCSGPPPRPPPLCLPTPCMQELNEGQSLSGDVHSVNSADSEGTGAPVPFNPLFAPRIEDMYQINCYHQCWIRFMNQLLLQGGDLLLADLSREEILSLLAQLHGLLSVQNWCSNVKMVASSMPVVKVQASPLTPSANGKGLDESPLIPIDISILTSEHMGLQARDYISLVVAELPNVFRPMVLILKQILREYDLHDVYKGGLGSYSVSLMVVFFLQRCGFTLKSSSELANMSDPEEVYKSSKPRAKRVPMFHLPPVSLKSSEADEKNFSGQSRTRPANSFLSSDRIFSSRVPSPILEERKSEPYCNNTGKYCARFEEMDKPVPEPLNIAKARIDAVLNPIRESVAEMIGEDDADVDVGLLLLTFLRLFSLPEAGGLDLGKVGISVENGGYVYVHNRPNSLCIRDPVANNHVVGIGSFSMSSVQGLFTKLQKQLSEDPSFIHSFIEATVDSRKDGDSSSATTIDEGDGVQADSPVPECVVEGSTQTETSADEMEDYSVEACITPKMKSKPRSLSSPCVIYSPLQQAVELPVSIPEHKAAEPLSVIEDKGDLGVGILSRPVVPDLEIESEDVEIQTNAKSPTSSWASLLAKGNSGKKTTAQSGVQCDSWASKAKPSTGAVAKPKESRAKVNVLEESRAQTSTGKKIKNMAEKTDKKNRSKCLFIGNVSYHASDADIKKLQEKFAQFGKIVETKKCLARGSIWITYESEGNALKALEHFDQKKFLKRPLFIDFSQKRK